MVNKYSLDEKLKERENAIVISEIEDARQFVRYFVNLMEGILNYEYDELKSYFEENKTEVEIRIIAKRYEVVSGIESCWISARVKLHREDYSYPKLKVFELKVADKFHNYTMDIDQFIYGSVKDEEYVSKYKPIIRCEIFKDFKYNWSYNKNKIFKRYIKNEYTTPSEHLIDCINEYIYDNIIKPKSRRMTRNEFLNSEFKLEVDKKTQKIHDKYFFDNIPNIKRRIITHV